MVQDLPGQLLASPSFQIERLRRPLREAVEAALAAHSTSLREYWALACVVEADASSQSALSDSLSIDASDMVRVIDSLENHGWVTRERDPKDRRRQIVAATKQGRNVINDLTRVVSEAEDHVLDVSTNKQLKHLRKLALNILEAEDQPKKKKDK